MWACKQGDLATVKMLSKEVKVEHIRDDFGGTLLHHAAE